MVAAVALVVMALALAVAGGVPVVLAQWRPSTVSRDATKELAAASAPPPPIPPRQQQQHQHPQHHQRHHHHVSRSWRRHPCLNQPSPHSGSKAMVEHG